MNPLGATVHPYTASGAAWVLASTGLTISQATTALLTGATAHDDGSFTAAGGTSYWLEVGFGSGGGFANAVPK